MTHATTGAPGNVGGVSSVGGVGSVGNVGNVGAGTLGGVNPLAAAHAPAPAPAPPAPSTQGADMKRAYEMLGIACPTSVSGMVSGGFTRAPLTRMPVRPGLDAPPNMPLFAPQGPPELQQQQQQQQLVSVVIHETWNVTYFKQEIVE